MKRRAFFTMTFSADLDMVPGWGHQPRDWVDLLRSQVAGGSCYNPEINVHGIVVRPYVPHLDGWRPPAAPVASDLVKRIREAVAMAGLYGFDSLDQIRGFLVEAAGATEAAEARSALLGAQVDEARKALPEDLRDDDLAHGVANLAIAHQGAHDGFYRYGQALCVALAFLDKAAGEGLSFVAEENGFPEMDAADLCALIAEAIGAEIDGPAWQALLSAGRERIAKAAAAEVPA